MFMDSPPRVKLPALTRMMLVPADRRERSTDARAPVPSATMAMTAATPMITPSMVSTVRIRLRPRAQRRRDARADEDAANHSRRRATMGSSSEARFAGYQPKNTPTSAGHAEGQDDRHRRHHRRPVERAGDQRRGNHADEDAGHAASEADRDGFEQELPHHVAGARADRQAQADLARALGHRQQRDVHDPDAADHQRHGRDRRQQPGHRAAGAFESGRELLERHPLELGDVPRHGSGHARRQPAGSERLGCLRQHREVIRLMVADAVALTKQLRDLARQSGHVARRCRRDGDVVQLRQVQQPVRRRVRHVDGVELVVAGRRLHHPGGAGHHAHDLERLAPQLHLLPDGLRSRAEQLVRDDLADHQHLRRAAPARAA